MIKQHKEKMSTWCFGVEIKTQIKMPHRFYKLKYSALKIFLLISQDIVLIIFLTLVQKDLLCSHKIIFEQLSHSLDRQGCHWISMCQQGNHMLEFYDNIQYSMKYAFTICLNIDHINAENEVRAFKM